MPWSSLSDPFGGSIASLQETQFVTGGPANPTGPQPPAYSAGKLSCILHIIHSTVKLYSKITFFPSVSFVLFVQITGFL
jgi:hypothetical protein